MKQINLKGGSECTVVELWHSHSARLPIIKALMADLVRGVQDLNQERGGSPLEVASFEETDVKKGRLQSTVLEGAKIVSPFKI